MKHVNKRFNVGYSDMPDSNKAYREHYDRIFGVKPTITDAEPREECPGCQAANQASQDEVLGTLPQE